MPEKTPPTLELVLSRGQGLGAIVVNVQAFFDLSFELAEELQDLIEQWKHFAPPRAQGGIRRARRGG